MSTARPVALVTGGSRGIGSAVVTRLAADGYDVAFCFRSRSEAAKQVAEQAAGLGARVRAEEVDVSDPAAAKDFVTATEEEFGPIAAAVTCAGITRDNPLVMMPDEDWWEVLNTNLGGTYNICRPMIYALMKRKRGCLVTMSSVSGLHGNAAQSNYAASKAGVIGFTLSLARECGRYGIRANSVVPGFIETDMTGGLPAKITDKVLARIPLGRFGSAVEVADMVSFLVSDRASYVTGQVLGVNGGLVI